MTHTRIFQEYPVSFVKLSFFFTQVKIKRQVLDFDNWHPLKWTYEPGANLTYLASPGQVCMGAKSFLVAPEIQRIFVLKDKIFCTI